MTHGQQNIKLTRLFAGVSGFGLGIFNFDPVFYALIQNKYTYY